MQAYEFHVERDRSERVAFEAWRMAHFQHLFRAAHFKGRPKKIADLYAKNVEELTGEKIKVEMDDDLRAQLEESNERVRKTQESKGA